MNDPLSWLFVEAVAARLALVRVDNGYRTDLGADVRLDVDMVDSGTLLGSVTYVVALEFEPVPEGTTQRQIATKLGFSVQAFIAGSSAEQMRLAHCARADLVQALRNTSVDLPRTAEGSASAIQILEASIEPRPGGADLIAVQITAQAGLTERIPAQ